MSFASEVVAGGVTILFALGKMTRPLHYGTLMGSSRASPFSAFLPCLRCAWDSEWCGIYL